MVKHDEEKVLLVLFGTKPDHTDGLAGIVPGIVRTLHGTEMEPGGVVAIMKDTVKKVDEHHAALYGTNANPSGIAKDVQSIKRVMYVSGAFVSACSAALVIIQFVSKVAPIVQQLSK